MSATRQMLRKPGMAPGRSFKQAAAAPRPSRRPGTLPAARHHTNLKQFRPQLSSNEKPRSGCVVSDPVQYRVRAPEFALVDYAAQIDPAEYLTRARRNAHNRIGLPDIRVDFSVDVFKLIQILYCSSGFAGNADAPGLSKGL